MPFSKKAAALAAGFVFALSLASLGQNAAPGTSTGETLLIDDATVDWIEKSDVAALREGVINKMELQIGMPVLEGKPIGYLHAEIAELTVAKAKTAVSSTAPVEKAEAQRELALAVLATNHRLNQRRPGMVSDEEMRKAEAELKVAEAMKREALEKIGLDKAELALANQALVEHTIVAPFDGIIVERKKNRGESVRANEPVVTLGNLDKLRAWFYIPLEHAYRVKEGQIVDLQLKITGARGTPLPIEQKRFRGKVSFVDPQVQPVAETAVRVHADFENPEHEMRPGLKAAVTIYLGTEGQGAGNPAVGIRSPNALGR